MPSRGISRNPFDPSSLMLDSGQSFSGPIDPHQLKLLGMEQNRQRRDQMTADNPGQMQTLRDPMWDSYFGVLQGRENAAGAAGKNFGVDFAGRRGDPFGNNEATEQDSPALRMLMRMGMKPATGLGPEQPSHEAFMPQQKRPGYR